MYPRDDGFNSGGSSVGVSVGGGSVGLGDWVGVGGAGVSVGITLSSGGAVVAPEHATRNNPMIRKGGVKREISFLYKVTSFQLDETEA